jgi:hypothetical protein
MNWNAQERWLRLKRQTKPIVWCSSVRSNEDVWIDTLFAFVANTCVRKSIYLQASSSLLGVCEQHMPKLQYAFCCTAAYHELVEGIPADHPTTKDVSFTTTLDACMLSPYHRTDQLYAVPRQKSMWCELVEGVSE